MNNKKYLSYIDELKGLGMLLVAMGHALAWCHPSYGFIFLSYADRTAGQTNALLVWDFIYSFHMPFLFMLSGFLFYNSKFGVEDVKAKLKSRCLRILLPYFVTGFIEFTYTCGEHYGHWFLQVLFAINIIALAEYYLINKLKLGIIAEACIHIAVFIGLYFAAKIEVHPDIYLSNMPYSYLGFVVGVYIKRYGKLMSFVQNDKVSLCMLAIFILLFATDLMQITLPQSLPIRISLATSMSLFLFAAFSKRPDSQSVVLKALQYIGKNSMEVYVLHMLFVPKIYEIGEYFLSDIPRSSNVSLQILYSLTASAFAISMALLVAKLLSCNRYLKLCLFGKK